MMYRFVVGFCRCIIRAAGRCRVEFRGLENLPSKGPAVLVANHASFLDPPVIAMATRRQIYFMAREGILRAPVLGPVLARCGVFAVRQGTADRAAIRQAVSLLTEGKLVCIFPEGSRSADGDLQAPHPGAALIASRAAVPLIPIALQGTRDAMPRDARWIRPGRIRVTFGEPIYLSDGETGVRRAPELAGISRRIMDEIERLLEGERAVA